jgi:hypothetical protein
MRYLRSSISPFFVISDMLIFTATMPAQIHDPVPVPDVLFGKSAVQRANDSHP